MSFHTTKLRVKELSKAMDVDIPEIIATCTILKIPASSPLSSLSIDQSKKIIDHIEKKTKPDDYEKNIIN